MADRPILFSAPMVRALLAGTKTQTRRIINPQPPAEATSAGVISRSGEGQTDEWSWLSGDPRDVDTWELLGDFRLRIKPDDRLYVREAWRVDRRHDRTPPRELEGAIRPLWFEAGYLMDTGRQKFWSDKNGADFDASASRGKFRQAMHMPRWASRITLIVEGVKVERLQDISHKDAIAEGIVEDDGDKPDIFYLPGSYLISGVNAPKGRLPIGQHHDPRLVYRDLINNLHGGDLWSENPWVAAYTSRVVMGNIDQIARTS